MKYALLRPLFLLAVFALALSAPADARWQFRTGVTLHSGTQEEVSLEHLYESQEQNRGILWDLSASWTTSQDVVLQAAAAFSTTENRIQGWDPLAEPQSFAHMTHSRQLHPLQLQVSGPVGDTSPLSIHWSAAAHVLPLRHAQLGMQWQNVRDPLLLKGSAYLRRRGRKTTLQWNTGVFLAAHSRWGLGWELDMGAGQLLLQNHLMVSGDERTTQYSFGRDLRRELWQFRVELRL